jgi:hypothetical protein
LTYTLYRDYLKTEDEIWAGSCGSLIARTGLRRSFNNSSRRTPIPVSWAIRLYPGILDFFFARGIDEAAVSTGSAARTHVRHKEKRNE